MHLRMQIQQARTGYTQRCGCFCASQGYSIHENFEREGYGGIYFCAQQQT